jgi:hypothetical protein
MGVAIMRWLSTILRIAVLCQCAFSARWLLATDRSPGSSDGAQWDVWAEGTKSALRLPTARELSAASRDVETALQTIEERLAEMPNGQILGRWWELAALHDSLRARPPSAVALQKAEAALASEAPRGLQPLVNALRHRVATLGQQATLAGNAGELERRRVDIEQLADFLKRRPQSSTRSEDLPKDIQACYARLVRVGLASQLAPVRQALSHPNAIVRLSSDYVRQAGERCFDVPVSFARNENGVQMHGSGSVRMRAHAVVVPNDSRAEIRVDSSGAGAVAIDAARRVASLDARDEMGVSGNQTLYLQPEGVSGDDPQVKLATDLSLDGVCLNLRSRVARKLLTPLAERVGSRQLDAHSDQISAEGQRIVRERLADEGFDIAYRLNALFQRSYWQRLARRDLESDLHLRSTAGGIEGWTENNHAWQLCAPAEAPLRSLPPADVQTFLHASAINNLADSLAGVRLDEAFYRQWIFEELKLVFGDPPADQPRIPAAVRLAEGCPLEVSFQDGTAAVTVRLAGCECDRVPIEAPPAVVHAAYRLKLDSRGLTLTRIRLDIVPAAANDTPLYRQVCERFFPKTLHSIPRFQNAGFEQHLTIVALKAQDEWLAIGLTRSEKASSPEQRTAASGATPQPLDR